MGRGVDGDPLRAIAGGGLDRVAGAPRVDQHLGLGMKAVLRGQPVLAVRQLDPFAGAVFIELGRVQFPAVEDVPVRLEVAARDIGDVADVLEEIGRASYRERV